MTRLTFTKPQISLLQEIIEHAEESGFLDDLNDQGDNFNWADWEVIRQKIEAE